MALLVQKFGGTSVGTPERIHLVADRIARSYAEGNQIAVVVSAMGHTTDELIELALQVSPNPHHREMDMLLTAGERISMALLSMALWDRKIPASSFTGSQSGIITDQSHRRARIRKILGDRVRNALSEKKVAIIAGFQGVSEEKEITTLGRGGSDTTAVALAAALRADVCEIYTDVDGVYSADPRIVSNARLWKWIPHELMVEMATRGAGVLHPRSVELAKQYNIPIQVKNSLNHNQGTTVISRHLGTALGMEEFGITGVTADQEKFLVSIELQRSTVLSSVWDRAAKAHLPILSPVFSETQVRFFSDRDAEGDWRKHLEELCSEGFVKSYQLETDIIPLSVVGDRFTQDGKALAEVLDLLSQQHVKVFLGSASSLAITVGISKNYAKEGVVALHSALVSQSQVPSLESPVLEGSPL